MPVIVSNASSTLRCLRSDLVEQCCPGVVALRSRSPRSLRRRYQASLGIAEEAADLAVGYLAKRESKL